MAEIKSLRQPLSLSFRPRTFDQMIGAEKMVKKIRERMKAGREPAAWLFTGKTGAGKTTVAKILAVSLQCTHQTKFGNPCEDCYRNQKKFDITEINASNTTRIEDFRRIIDELVNYAPFPGSRRKVIILDELHKASDASQNALLKPFEECPKTTVWICCTTRPNDIIETLRRRCGAGSYVVPPLNLEAARKLIQVAVDRIGSNKDSEELAEALLEAGITSPGLVVNAVEKYLEDPTCTAEEAVRSDGVSEIDISALNRCVIRGLWPDAAKWLNSCSKSDAGEIKNRLMVYLREMILNDKEFSERNSTVAKAIRQLASTQFLGDETQVALISAVVYDLCYAFRALRK